MVVQFSKQVDFFSSVFVAYRNISYLLQFMYLYVFQSSMGFDRDIRSGLIVGLHIASPTGNPQKNVLALKLIITHERTIKNVLAFKLIITRIHWHIY